MRSVHASLSALLLLTQLPALGQRSDDDAGLRLLMQLSSDSDWKLLQTTPLDFEVHHPQGMTRIGDSFYMTAVETIVPPEAIPDSESKYDRTPGAGKGYLFKFDLQGKLEATISLGEGSKYHPGGIDYDGENLWISVAEYRPASHSIVYTVNPETLDVTEVFRFDDHLGGVLRNPADGAIYGLNWGSQTLYRWTETEARRSPALGYAKTKTGSDVDYQDCQRVTEQAMLCSGMRSLPIDNTHYLTIGGLELVDLSKLEVMHKIRVSGTAPGGELLTRNPFWFEYDENQRGNFYFVPEDDQATLYRYAPARQ